MAKIPDNVKEASIISTEEWKEWTKTVWSIANVSDPIHPAVFPLEIPHRLIRMFSFYGETVLDPFSGMGTTGKSAIINGRRYVGIEVNSEYLQLSYEQIIEFANTNNIVLSEGDISLINDTCLNMDYIPDNSIGVVVTSPPYWNKADYGDYEGNIGSIKFYDDFLNYMETVISNCYRVLMPGRKLCIVTANVNQNTKEYGLVTIPIASDLTKIAQQKGFSLVNQIIWNKNGTGGKWGSANSQRPIFGSYPYPPNFLFKNVNEYIIIVQKPDPKKKNSKAPSYFDLFRNEPR
ncbi:site-specific DNA-methyltransferase [Pelotomaculum terephthalicicum JT]|jgi:site-specific DNA-methyltransferase (adenine-specific)|uniref:site-specific DNA-methyltransferase n=1 Tax=Pelotomaculum terephthalicicum TaxID=206393 RepID=UPI001F036714|nr:site-specific DNA-methyltransferase [Pelotomaculum terephthalicicum]MCG9967563.1 site-specific DNA-methyltransferase [Pelotomaculum terephthalicicum JT]